MFWHGTDVTHPNPIPQAVGLPNWVYYYAQLFSPFQQINPNTGLVNNYSVTYVNDNNKSTATAGSSSNPALCPITIHNGAYGNGQLPVFDIGPTVDPVTNTTLVRWVGDLQVSGIFNFVRAVGHEQGHVISYTTNVTLTVPAGQPMAGQQIPGTVYMTTKALNPFPATLTCASADGDQLWDSWEYLNHMDPTVGDTTGCPLYGANKQTGLMRNGDHADNEVLADINALYSVFHYIYLWQNDWDDQGINFSQPYFAAFPLPKGDGDPPNKPPVFYLNFIAGVNGKSFIQGNSYPIRTLQDLQAEYPSVLTTLP